MAFIVLEKLLSRAILGKLTTAIPLALYSLVEAKNVPEQDLILSQIVTLIILFHPCRQ